MTWTDIDDDLDNEESEIALIGIATGVISLVNVLFSGFFDIYLTLLSAISFGYFLVMSLSEIERRGRAITKFRERPSRMREILSDLEHDQWVGLTKYYANQEDEIQVSDEKLDYWKDLWVDYEKLSEEMKDKDRKYADKVIEALEEVDYYGT